MTSCFSVIHYMASLYYTILHLGSLGLFYLHTLGFSFRLPSFSLLISRHFYSKENKIKILFDCQLPVSLSQYFNLEDVCLKQNRFHKITTTGMESLLNYLVLGLSSPFQKQWMCVPSASSDRRCWLALILWLVVLWSKILAAEN